MDPRQNLCSDMVTAEMMDLMAKQALTMGEIQFREALRADLEMELRSVFHPCHLYLYGSSVNSFGCHGCDMDLYLDLHIPFPQHKPPRTQMSQTLSLLSKRKAPDFFWRIMSGHAPPVTPEDLLYVDDEKITLLLASVLGMSGRYEVCPIPSARTPIVKMLHVPSKLSLDVSFTGRGLVLRNTGLLRHYSSLDPRVRPLVFTIRRWAVDKQLDGPAGLTSYCVTMLVMFFLCDVLPSIFPPSDTLLAGHSIYHPTPVESLPDHSKRKNSVDMAATCSELLLKFFQFYSRINFAQSVIEIKSGNVVVADDFCGPNDFKFAYMNVQDPFDLSHNIAKSVDFFTFLSFHEEIKRAICVLMDRSASLNKLLRKVIPPPVLPELPLARRKLVRDSVEHKELAWNYYCLSRNKCLDEDLVEGHLWAKVELCRNILEDFFKWEVTTRDIKGDSYGDDVTLPDSFEVYAIYDCKATNSSWTGRNPEKLRLKTDARLKGIPGECVPWITEMLIGDKLHARTQGQNNLEFSIVMINHFVDWHALYMGILFKTDSPKARDLSKYMQKNISKLFTKNQFGDFTMEDIDKARDMLRRIQNGEIFHMEPENPEKKVVQSATEDTAPVPSGSTIDQLESELMKLVVDHAGEKNGLKADKGDQNKAHLAERTPSPEVVHTAIVVTSVENAVESGVNDEGIIADKELKIDCPPLRVRDLPLTYFFRETVPGVFAMMEEYYCCEKLNYTAKHMKNCLNLHNAGQWYILKFATWRGRTEAEKTLTGEGDGDAKDKNVWIREQQIGQLIRASGSADIEPFRFYLKINDVKEHDIRLRFIPFEQRPDALEFLEYVRGRIVGDLRDALEKGRRFVDVATLHSSYRKPQKYNQESF